jgi:hypothetical protein
MNRQSLVDLLNAEHVRDDAYSLSGDRGESMCLEPVAGGWAVYYSERGLRSGERLFETEDEACQFLASRLLADPSNRLADSS